MMFLHAYYRMDSVADVEWESPFCILGYSESPLLLKCWVLAIGVPFFVYWFLYLLFKLSSFL